MSASPTGDGWWPCKLGTVPAVVKVHGSDEKKMIVGNWIRIKESDGDKWHSVLLTLVEPEYFTADR